ncbi:MAG: tRNA uridine-5-carboxymethylaminomethyl(34) synthesis GTPase MnmE [Synechococcales bacterium]|nr:tRNA uridine-5-carboxymethylaminomethyl(34) synthesis GTPase MnmE [Cyanobacteria bacterium REEB444]MEB3124736.1 tRNA uridine-5-carboxymethylaminomethyl(34) synthesis GTPase MnmE [Synechococcales bacterium]
MTTIVAIATAIVPEHGSVGIVKLSGTTAVAIAHQLFQTAGQQVWESHRILYGHICDPVSAERIDEALLLLMLAPRSYTREDVVEFHCHGGMMAVQRVLQLCLSHGARLAQPGEFTLRAFLHGRLDLTQAESVYDLVAARSTRAAQLAMAGLKGKLADPIRQLRMDCLHILAEVEARIDFEDDLPPLNLWEIHTSLAKALSTVTTILATAHQGQLIRAGLKVAIIGRPNVGKSSLLNAWSQTDRAIVTDLPGTTRDVVESQLVVGGIPVQVLDTAGIRETEDPIEKIGVMRTQAVAQSADLILLIIDAQSGWTAADESIFEHITKEQVHRSLILIINKIDLVSEPSSIWLPETLKTTPQVLTAAAQNRGIHQLEEAILATVHTGTIQAANWELAINQRQAAVLQRAKMALEQVQETILQQLPVDFWTIDLRTAIQAFGEITGEEITESVLEHIFNRFCIGK